DDSCCRAGRGEAGESRGTSGTGSNATYSCSCGDTGCYTSSGYSCYSCCTGSTCSCETCCSCCCRSSEAASSAAEAEGRSGAAGQRSGEAIPRAVWRRVEGCVGGSQAGNDRGGPGEAARDVRVRARPRKVQHAD